MCTQTHTHTHTTYHKTSSFIKPSCEHNHIKGNMWSGAVVLQRRSGPDGFLSVTQTGSPWPGLATLYTAPTSPLIFSPPLYPFVLFHGFPVLARSNRNNGGDMQQRRWAGCRPTASACTCVCVQACVCVHWLVSTRTSVWDSDHKDNKPKLDIVRRE